MYPGKHLLMFHNASAKYLLCHGWSAYGTTLQASSRKQIETAWKRISKAMFFSEKMD